MKKNHNKIVVKENHEDIFMEDDFEHATMKESCEDIAIEDSEHLTVKENREDTKKEKVSFFLVLKQGHCIGIVYVMICNFVGYNKNTRYGITVIPSYCF